MGVFLHYKLPFEFYLGGLKQDLASNSKLNHSYITNLAHSNLFGLSQIDLDDTLMVELVSFNERLPIKAAERRRRPIKHQITVFPL